MMRGDVGGLVDFYETRLAASGSEADQADRWSRWISAVLAKAIHPLGSEDGIRLEVALGRAERGAPSLMVGRIRAARVLLRQNAGDAEAAVTLVTSMEVQVGTVTNEDLGYLLSLRARSLEALGRHEQALDDYLRAATLDRAAGGLEGAARLAAGGGSWITDTSLVRLVEVAVETGQYRIARESLGPLMARLPGLSETAAMAVLRTFVRLQVKSQVSLLDYRRDWQRLVAGIRAADRRLAGELAGAIDDAWSDRVYSLVGTERVSVQRLPRWLQKDSAERGEMARLLVWIGQAFVESDGRLVALGVNRFLAAWKLDPDDRQALEFAAASLASDGGRTVPADVREAFEVELVRHALRAASRLGDISGTMKDRLTRNALREASRAVADATWGLSLIGDVAQQSQNEIQQRAAVWLHMNSALIEDTFNLLRCGVGEPRIDVTRLWDVLLESPIVDSRPEIRRELAVIAAYDSLVRGNLTRARKLAETAVRIGSSESLAGAAWKDQLELTLTVTEPNGSSTSP